MPQKLLRKFCQLVAACLALALSTGCASNRGGEAPLSYLNPSEGLKPVSVNAHANFQAYAKAVEEQLRHFRVPFDPSQFELEIQSAKPTQYGPGPDCVGQPPQGVAILVHGLSDTAFSLTDIARVIASQCFVARTVLLPGHGTRPGDLLVTDLSDWRNTITELVEQAASEYETVVLGGFSLGAVLTLSNALEPNSPVDALIAFSPAYSLSSYKLARFAPYVHLVKRWVDRGLPDDYLRYEAMPMRGVAETVKAMKNMHYQLGHRKTIDIPWLVVQSMDDAVVQPSANIQLFRKYAVHPKSKIINFYTDQAIDEDSRTIWLRGDDEKLRVLGITHAGVANSPNNSHYGLHGDYRNCGQTAPREQSEVKACLNAEKVWYGLWNKPAPANLITARNTFNPQFEVLARHIAEFLQ